MDYLEKLKNIVDPCDLTVSEADCLSYSRDTSLHVGVPDVVVFPRTTEQVIEIVKAAYESGVPLIPRGAGTSVTGAALAPLGGILMDLAHMNRILAIDKHNGYAVVQPAVICEHLNTQLSPSHFFPPDPGSAPIATIGGMISTNASGVRAVKYGTTKNFVMGLTVVMADGRIITTGSRVPKNSTGFDLTQLFVGAEGTLGIIVEAVVRILPKPDAWMFAKIDFRSIEDAGNAVTEIMTSGIPISICEIMDRVSIDIVAEKWNLSVSPEILCQILIEIDGKKAAIDTDAGIIESICQKHKAIEVRWTQDAGERKTFSTIRHGLVPAMSRIKPFHRLVPLVEDFGVPTTAIPDTIRGIQDIGRAHGFPIATFGHIGDGNLHATFIIDVRNPDEWKKVKAIALDLIQLTLEQGGTLSAEHGIGMAKTPYVHRQLGASVDVMRQIKKAMDPKNILNPGKLVFDDGIKDIFEKNAFDALIRNPDNLKSFGPEVDQEILACTQCGFCHAGCPTYAMTKLESMNARGRVALAYNMLTNQISPSADLTARLYQCTDCLNCKYTCPAAVNLSAIIHAARERLVRDGQLPEVHRKLMESIVTHGNPFSEPATKRTDVFPKAFKAKQTANTLFFLGCVASFQDTKITPSIMRLADAAAENYTVLGAAEYCCGYLSYLVGDGKTFARCREETVSRIKTSGADTVVATCAGCYKTLSALYPKHGSDFEGIRVIHAIEYLEKVIVQGRLPLKADESHLKVVYHDPCDIGRHMGIYEPPRNVIRSIPGVELVEFPLNRSLAKCCGGGGGVKAFDNSLASDIAFDRVKQALDLRADAIVSACPSCKNSLNQGSARARKEKIGKIRVMDLTELVASRLE